MRARQQRLRSKRASLTYILPDGPILSKDGPESDWGVDAAELSFQFEGGLEHGAGIAGIEGEAGVTTATGVIRLEVSAFAIDIERARMFGINQARIFLPNQFSHHGKHVDQTFIDEDFRIVLVGLTHADVAEMDVVDAIVAAEVAADLDRVVAHLARDAAVEGNAVRLTGNNFDQSFPAFHSAHNLTRSAADGGRRIIGMESHADSGVFGYGDDGF